MRTVLGLDFGTSNSALSVYSNGKIKIVHADPFNVDNQTLKSILFFGEEEGEKYIGRKAIVEYLEYSGLYGRLMQSIKTFLPDKDLLETYVKRERYDIEDLVAMILGAMKYQGELHVGHVVDSVVLGRPVFFSKDRGLDLLAEKRLRNAAVKAGFVNIWFQYEPIAAALSYEGNLKSGEEKLAFVGDFGGGTSDFTIVRLRGSGAEQKLDRKEDVLSVNGAYIGGDTFDSRIMSEKVAKHFGKDTKFRSTTNQMLNFPLFIISQLCQWHRIPQLRDRETLRMIREIKPYSNNLQAIKNLEHLILENLGYMIFRVIEQAKFELSVSKTAVISFNKRGVSFREQITKEEFEYIIKEDLRQLSACIDSTLINAGVKKDDIDVVLLTGGTSLVPCVKSLVAGKFQGQEVIYIDAFTSVAYGLGATASAVI